MFNKTPYNLEMYRQLISEINSSYATFMPIIIINGIFMVLSSFFAEISWQIYSYLGIFARSSSPLLTLSQVLSIFSILFFFSAVGFWIHLDTTVQINYLEIRKIESAEGLKNTYQMRKFNNPLRKYVTPLLKMLMAAAYILAMAVLMLRIQEYWVDIFWVPIVFFAILSLITTIIMVKSKQYVSSFRAFNTPNTK